MFSPFTTSCSWAETIKKAPSPCPAKPDKKGRSLKSMQSPRYHPFSARTHKKLQAALKRRNGAQPSCANEPMPFAQAARERTSVFCTRKPFQPVKPLSLPCRKNLLSPSLRLGVFRFYNQVLCYHISGQFARAVQSLSAKIASNGGFCTKPQPL